MDQPRPTIPKGRTLSRTLPTAPHRYSSVAPVPAPTRLRLLSAPKVRPQSARLPYPVAPEVRPQSAQQWWTPVGDHNAGSQTRDHSIDAPFNLLRDRHGASPQGHPRPSSSAQPLAASLATGYRQRAGAFSHEQVCSAVPAGHAKRCGLAPSTARTDAAHHRHRRRFSPPSRMRHPAAVIAAALQLQQHASTLTSPGFRLM